MSEYNIGGTLSSDDPNYVSRLADRVLYEGLQTGKLCYVFNSRQMGKSSLLAHTKHRLETEGVICAALDFSNKSTQVTSDKWYPGLLWRLSRDLGLAGKSDFDFSSWWQAQQRLQLEPTECFEEFLEAVVLREIPQRVVILIDEIDSILGCDFSDGFFATIRKCYNKRSEQSDYRRLSFVLAGVATPYDLIQGQNHTPFNIGQAIELTGIQLDEAQPLLRGLTGKADRPEAVLREIINWTGGQPFLTQKLCNLAATVESPIAEGAEPERIKQLVQEHILNNWEAQDEPQHLRTIRDRLLNPGNEPRMVRLLGLYQQILQQGEIEFDGSPEQLELRLSGLVVNQQGKLRVFNKIYEFVFNQEWIGGKLNNLRDPKYAAALAAWLASERQPEHLLRRDTLRDAQNWSVGKQLSNEDYQFLADSQRREVQEIQTQVDHEKQKLQRRSIFASVASILFVASLVGAIVSAKSAIGSRNEAETAKGEAETAISERDSAIKERNRAIQEEDSAVEERDGAIEERDQAKSQALQAEQQAKQASEQAQQAQADAATAQGDAAIARSEAEEARAERNRSQREVTIAQQIATLEQQGTNLLRSQPEQFRNIDNLLVAMELGQDTHQLINNGAAPFSIRSPLLALRLAINSIVERNVVPNSFFYGDEYFLSDKQQMFLSFAPSGHEAVGECRKGEKTYLYDLSSGRRLTEFQGRCYELSHDRQLLITRSNLDEEAWNDESNQLFRLYDITGKELMSQIGTSLSFSPNGKIILACGNGNTYLYTQTGNLLHQIQGSCGRFSPNGNYLVLNNKNHSFLYHSNDLSSRPLELRGQFKEFVGDSSKLITTSDDKTYLYSLDNSTNPILVEVRGKFLGISPDDQKLVTHSGLESTDGHTNYIYNFSGKKIGEIPGRIYDVKRSFNSTGSVLAATRETDNISYLYKVQTQHLVSITGKFNKWSNDGKYITTYATTENSQSSGHEKTFYLYTSTGQELASVRGNADQFSPNQKYWLVHSDSDNTSYLYSISDMFSGETSKLSGINPRWSFNGERIITSLKGSEAENERLDQFNLYDLSGRQIAQLTGDSLSFSPDGEHVITSSNRENASYLYDSSGNQKTQFSGSLSRLSPDGKFLITKLAGTSYLYDLSGNELVQFSSEYSLFFSPDGSSLISWGEGPIETRLYHLSNNWLSRFRASAVELSPDGEMLAISGRSDTTHLYSKSSGFIAELQGKQFVKFIGFHQGQFLKTRSSGNKEYLYDLSGRKIVEGRSITVSPNGQRIAVSTEDNKLYLYSSLGNIITELEGTHIEGLRLSKEWILTYSSEQDISYLYNYSGHRLADLHGIYAELGLYTTNNSDWLVTRSKNNEIHIYDALGQKVNEAEELLGDSVSFSNTKQQLVSYGATSNSMSYLYDFPKRQLKHLVGTFSRFSPDDQWIVTYLPQSNGMIRYHLYASSGEKQAEFQGYFSSLSIRSDYRPDFSLDGQRVLIYAKNEQGGKSHLYDLSGSKIAELQGVFSEYQSSFIPGVERIVTTDSVAGKSYLYDYSGSQLASLEGNSVWFYPNVQRILSSSLDKIYVYDLSGDLIATFQEASIDFSSSDEQKLAVYSKNEDTTRFYNWSGNLLAEFLGKENYHDNGSNEGLLLTKTKDGYFYIWQLDEGLDDLLARGCSWLSAYFETHPEALERLEVCQK